MPIRRVAFDNGRGQRLSGILHAPPGFVPTGYAVFAHCFTCSKDLRAARVVAEALTDDGIGVLRFDFTGIGHSEGSFEDKTFAHNVDDLVAAARWVEATENRPVQVLVGHSWGGPAVIEAAGELPNVRAVATIGAPSDPAHVLNLLEDDLETIERQGAATVRIGGRSFRVGRSLIEDLRSRRFDEAVRTLRRALLIMHSPTDNVVGIHHAARLYQLAKHPKSFISLHGADHLLSRPEDSRYAARVVAAWASRYLEPIPHPAEDDPDAAWQVSAEIGRTYRTRLTARGFPLVGDEPVEEGGGGEGPNPYDLLLSALGECKAMTMRMYADHKGWPLKAATVRLRHNKVFGRDCAKAEAGEDVRVDCIRVEIDLDGPLTEAQRKRIVEISDRCPVHRTLTGPVGIDTHLAPRAPDDPPLLEEEDDG